MDFINSKDSIRQNLLYNFGFIHSKHDEPFNGQIPSEEFLSASKEVVDILDRFGKMFMPMKYDMQSNIEKLTKTFNQDKRSYSTLQKLVLAEKCSANTTVADALLWLSRSLHMVQAFFECIVKDHETNKNTEDQTANLTKAYESTLEPYQGYTAQQLFYLLTRMAPSRSQILKGLANGYDIEHAIIIRSMGRFSKRLRENIYVLKTFYNEHSL